MYRDVNDATVNMEHLWYTNSTDNADPEGNSLFNITTLKTLVTLG